MSNTEKIVEFLHKHRETEQTRLVLSHLFFRGEITQKTATEEYGIAFRQGSDVTAMVNQAIADLTAEGVVAELAAKYGLTAALVTAE